jgi:hypothetical protein
MTLYRERLSPSWWMVLAIGLVMPATALIFLPLNVIVGVVAGVGMWVGAIAVLWAFSPVISVNPEGLRVGNAFLEKSYVGDAVAFNGEEARHEKGPGAHGLAWLKLSPWVDPVVKITVVDPEDPTPYWLVSSRNPEDFIRALGAL